MTLVSLIWPAVLLCLGFVLAAFPDVYQRIWLRDRQRDWRSRIQLFDDWGRSDAFRILVRIVGMFFCILGVIVLLASLH